MAVPQANQRRTVGANSYMAILRKRQIENLEQMSGEQLKAFLDAMPAGQESMSELLDYVEEALRLRVRPHFALRNAIYDGARPQLSKNYQLAQRKRRLLRLRGHEADRPVVAGEIWR